MDEISRPDGRTGDGGDPDWTWAPFAPEEPEDIARFRIEEWAPASTVRYPWVRVGRFTLLHRRAA